jgi:hypothetical protein
MLCRDAREKHFRPEEQAAGRDERREREQAVRQHAQPAQVLQEAQHLGVVVTAARACCASAIAALVNGRC